MMCGLLTLMPDHTTLQVKAFCRLTDLKDCCLKLSEASPGPGDVCRRLRRLTQRVSAVLGQTAKNKGYKAPEEKRRRVCV